MTTDSHIEVTPYATVFQGADATRMYASHVLYVSLNMYARFKMLPTRGISATRMLELATTYTGKQYKRGQHAEAAVDVKLWRDTMIAALPIVHKGEKQ